MSIFSLNFADIPSTLSAIGGFIAKNPILSIILFTSYALYYIYMFIHHKASESDVYEIDLISAGISSMMVGLLLIGLDESSQGLDLSGVDFGSQTTLIAFGLIVYAAILFFCAFTKILPKVLVVILGTSELDIFINFLAMLMTDAEMTITGTTIFVIGVPLLILFVIQRIRRVL